MRLYNPSVQPQQLTVQRFSFCHLGQSKTLHKGETLFVTKPKHVSVFLVQSTEQHFIAGLCEYEFVFTGITQTHIYVP